MEKFAGYGFNKSHAAPYALIAYQTAWLKANAPVEFFAASMSLDISNTDKLAVFYQDAQRAGRRRPPARHQPLGRRLRGRGRRGALCPGRGAQRRPGGDGAPGRGARGGRAVPRSVRLPGAHRSAPAQQAGAGEPGPRRRLRRHPPEPRPDPRRRRRPDRPTPRASPPSAPRAQASLFGGEHADAARPRAARRPRRWTPAASSTRSWRRSASTSAATRWTTWSRCCAASAPRSSPTPWPRPRRAPRRSAWPASCAAARSASASGSGEKFAFVTLSDPTGEYEVLFPPEALRRCRDVLEPGAARADQGARQGRPRATCASSATTPSRSTGRSSPRPPRCASTCRRPPPMPARCASASKPRTPAAATWFWSPASPAAAKLELKLPGRYVLDAAARGALKTAPGVTFLEDA